MWLKTSKIIKSTDEVSWAELSLFCGHHGNIQFFFFRVPWVICYGPTPTTELVGAFHHVELDTLLGRTSQRFSFMQTNSKWLRGLIKSPWMDSIGRMRSRDRFYNSNSSSHDFSLVQASDYQTLRHEKKNSIEKLHATSLLGQTGLLLS